MPDGERTEQATPRRREEARKRGQVAVSHELLSAISFISGIMIISSLIPTFYRQFVLLFKNYIRNMYIGDITIKETQKIMINLSYQAFLILIPILGILFIVILLVGFIQTGFLFSSEAITPRLSRINPLIGIRRIFSKRALIDILKAIIKIIILGYLGYSFTRGVSLNAFSLWKTSLFGSLEFIVSNILRFSQQAGIVLLAIGVLDYMFQRREFETTIRMTREELKEELKETEGDPLIRSRIRQKQKEMAMRRMMQEVKKADVVITNPTEYAVALKYDVKKMNAPIVIAKGARLMAERIKNEARRWNIPIVVNPPLAQMLYKLVDIGEEIPPRLYQAVAEVLAYVYRRRGRLV
ncbi:MAG: flagellar biosynthesis protein FlhB [bacterium]|nr:flagellar biosynthesis protein FlhB [bacterium]